MRYSGAATPESPSAGTSDPVRTRLPVGPAVREPQHGFTVGGITKLRETSTSQYGNEDQRDLQEKCEH